MEDKKNVREILKQIDNAKKQVNKNKELFEKIKNAKD